MTPLVVLVLLVAVPLGTLLWLLDAVSGTHVFWAVMGLAFVARLLGPAPTQTRYRR
jgi:low temperature requirement protein LtrA